jgi:hypothetical protein
MKIFTLMLKFLMFNVKKIVRNIMFVRNILKAFKIKL